MTSRDRKGNIHPGLQELIKNEEDEFVGTSQKKKENETARFWMICLKNLNFDPLEDDADSMTSKQKDQQLAQENSADPPFKIIISREKKLLWLEQFNLRNAPW